MGFLSCFTGGCKPAIAGKYSYAKESQGCKQVPQQACASTPANAAPGEIKGSAEDVPHPKAGDAITLSPFRTSDSGPSTELTRRSSATNSLTIGTSYRTSTGGGTSRGQSGYGSSYGQHAQPGVDLAGPAVSCAIPARLSSATGQTAASSRTNSVSGANCVSSGQPHHKLLGAATRAGPQTGNVTGSGRNSPATAGASLRAGLPAPPQSPAPGLKSSSSAPLLKISPQTAGSSSRALKGPPYSTNIRHPTPQTARANSGNAARADSGNGRGGPTAAFSGAASYVHCEFDAAAQELLAHGMVNMAAVHMEKKKRRQSMEANSRRLIGAELGPGTGGGGGRQQSQHSHYLPQQDQHQRQQYQRRQASEGHPGQGRQRQVSVEGQGRHRRVSVEEADFARRADSVLTAYRQQCSGMGGGGVAVARRAQAPAASH